MTATTPELERAQHERDDALRQLASTQAALRRAELAGQASAGDVARARAEALAMRERCRALAAELDAAAMAALLAERHAQSLLAAKARAEAEAHSVGRQLLDVYASRSWRLARPLRAIARPRRTIGLIMARLRPP